MLRNSAVVAIFPAGHGRFGHLAINLMPAARQAPTISGLPDMRMGKYALFTGVEDTTLYKGELFLHLQRTLG